VESGRVNTFHQQQARRAGQGKAGQGKPENQNNRFACSWEKKEKGVKST